MEAWDTLGVVEDHLVDPDGGLDELLVVTHRLRGAASLNGFPKVAALAAVMESVVERAMDEADAAALEDGRFVLADLLHCLKKSLDRIGTSGEEDAAAIDAVLIRHGGVAADGGPAAPVTPSGLLDDLDRFFRDNSEVLEYFVPEATEHLDLAAQSLLALEREGASDAEVARLFRAVHTLKGAAYTVGCTIIGTLAHRVEDLLAEVRDGRRELGETGLEAVHGALDALRLLVQSAEGVPAGRLDAWTRAGRLLDALAQETQIWTTEDDEASAAAEATGAVDPATPALESPTTSAPAPAAQTPAAVRPSIRVNLDR